jgi:tryptophan-rich sensory protein
MATRTRKTNAKGNDSAQALQRWGGIAAFALAFAAIGANGVYLTGNLNEPGGILAYDVADFLAGPVWAASLVTMVLALREHIGELAPRRMNLALGIALLAAAAMLSVALMRSANRHYHLIHPELHLGDSYVMVVWTTLIAGISATAFHLYGWASVLIGWAGQASKRIPVVLSALYVAVGVAALFVYLQPELEGAVLMFGSLTLIWQGILLLGSRSGAR